MKPTLTKEQRGTHHHICRKTRQGSTPQFAQANSKNIQSVLYTSSSWYLRKLEEMKFGFDNCLLFATSVTCRYVAWDLRSISIAWLTIRATEALANIRLAVRLGGTTYSAAGTAGRSAVWTRRGGKCPTTIERSPRIKLLWDSLCNLGLTLRESEEEKQNDRTFHDCNCVLGML